METKEQTKLFRQMGYTFESLVSHYLMEQKYQQELLQRLKLIDRQNGKVCLCSAMVIDQEKEGNTVPYLYCIIKGGKERIGCPYVKATDDEIKKALELHKELKERQ
jgi:hypothetical protein